MVYTSSIIVNLNLPKTTSMANSKKEHWRNQTLVNRTLYNNEIAREYYTLAIFIMDNYKEKT